jgi:hypothetical protein
MDTNPLAYKVVILEDERNMVTSGTSEISCSLYEFSFIFGDTVFVVVHIAI